MSATYNAANVTVAVGGAPIGNLSKDTFIDISYDEDAVTMRKSVQGGVIYSIAAANMATVTLTIEANSLGNDLLSGLYLAQSKTGGGSFPFTVVDNNVPDGRTIFNCGNSRVAQMPSMQYGSEVGTVQWKILCGEVTHFIGAIPAASALPV